LPIFSNKQQEESKEGADIWEMKKSLLGVTALLFFMTVRLSAHHAFAAEYDEHRRIAVTGKVMKFKWTNPHAWLDVAVKDKSGKVITWSFEMGSPVGLSARCWVKTDLKTGDLVTVEGFGAKDGRNVANATFVILPDSRKLFGGFQETPGAPPKLWISGTRKNSCPDTH
jgi:hypothetical protein